MHNGISLVHYWHFLVVSQGDVGFLHLHIVLVQSYIYICRLSIEADLDVFSYKESYGLQIYQSKRFVYEDTILLLSQELQTQHRPKNVNILLSWVLVVMLIKLSIKFLFKTYFVPILLHMYKTGQIGIRPQSHKSPSSSGTFCNAQIKEHRSSQLISITLNAIYKEQHKRATIAALSSAKCVKTCFIGALNYSANTCKFTTANISKSGCTIHLNTLNLYILCLKGKLL